ncbi:hypothetical protein F1188_06245 [Roseospira marina]|uniref:Right handed beta helix domain-containing protein n=1 Tax=Roseospira marina TaxID=140057 RepID=A0A5M6IDZ2_9PROT|nr:right-handed parallel beta-helix repeat-containing protein [Roseospira marina]KAA5606463.1 hypothetical protein F1188_06245 [Roseospira marina]MBB4314119.1 hypothetical protein [Roseospira marina]MBB5087280.1 hypothetical protein [Roseospira marina]
MFTIDVTDHAELMAALQSVQGGETIVLEAGDYGDLHLNAEDVPSLRDLDTTVTITSKDPRAPALFTGLEVTGADNLTFDHLQFSYDAAPGAKWFERPFQVVDVDSVTFRHSTFLGDLAERTGTPVDGYGTGFGLRIADSENITVESSVFATFRQGIVLSNVENSRVTGNAIFNMSGDGIKASELNKSLIEGNYVHDFHASPKDNWHFDLIQIFSNVGRNIRPSSDVTIRGNVLDSGDGIATQSIFIGIGGAHGRRLDRDFHFQDILIENNLIHNAHLNAIAAATTDGLVIRNNTLVHNADINHGRVSIPRIVSSADSTNVQIYDNILPGSVAFSATDPGSGAWNNFVTQDKDPSQPTYVQNVFSDALGGGKTQVLTDLQLRPDSVAAGLGASLDRVDAVPSGDLAPRIELSAARAYMGDPITLDASLAGLEGGPSTAPGAAYAWTIVDDATGAVVADMKGAAVEVTPRDFGSYTVHLTARAADGTVATNATRLEVLDPRLMAHDFTSGRLVDMSGYGGDATIERGARFEEADGRTSLHLSKHATVALDQRGDCDELYGLDAFTIEFGMRRDYLAGGWGDIFRMHTSTEIGVTRQAEIGVSLATQAGEEVQVTTWGAGLRDTDWHLVAVRYEAARGQLDVFVDGALRGTGDITGKTLGPGAWAPTLGNPWKDGFIGDISHITMYATPLPDEALRAAWDAFQAGKIESGMIDLPLSHGPDGMDFGAGGSE